MKLAKKLIIPSAMILAISPVAIIASCNSTVDQNDPSVLKKLVEDLNNNPPVWNDDYGKPTPGQSEVVAKIAKNDLDQMSVANQHHLLLNKIKFNQDQKADYQISAYTTDVNPDNHLLGTISYKIKITINNQSEETNVFTLKYQAILENSKALAKQKEAFIKATQNQDFILDKNKLPKLFDPSVTAFYKAVGMNENTDFDQWKDLVFSKFVATEAGLKVSLNDLNTIYTKTDPAKSWLNVRVEYEDLQTKEKWTAPYLKLGYINLQEEINIDANKDIIEFLNSKQAITLSASAPEKIDQNNLLANTNFDDLKNHWMVSDQVNYQVIDFNQTDQKISFKIKITKDAKTVTTKELVINRQ